MESGSLRQLNIMNKYTSAVTAAFLSTGALGIKGHVFVTDFWGPLRTTNLNTRENSIRGNSNLQQTLVLFLLKGSGVRLCLAYLAQCVHCNAWGLDVSQVPFCIILEVIGGTEPTGDAWSGMPPCPTLCHLPAPLGLAGTHHKAFFRPRK